jgi:hypothetical protein
MSQPGGYTIAPGDFWTGQASTWPVVIVQRETEPGHWLTDVVPAKPVQPLMQLHLCCAQCPDYPSVFCLSPDTGQPGYAITMSDVLAGILGHIRRSHPDVVAS